MAQWTLNSPRGSHASLIPIRKTVAQSSSAADISMTSCHSSRSSLRSLLLPGAGSQKNLRARLAETFQGVSLKPGGRLESGLTALSGRKEVRIHFSTRYPNNVFEKQSRLRPTEMNISLSPLTFATVEKASPTLDSDSSGSHHDSGFITSLSSVGTDLSFSGAEFSGPCAYGKNPEGKESSPPKPLSQDAILFAPIRPPRRTFPGKLRFDISLRTNIFNRKVGSKKGADEVIEEAPVGLHDNKHQDIDHLARIATPIRKTAARFAKMMTDPSPAVLDSIKQGQKEWNAVMPLVVSQPNMVSTSAESACVASLNRCMPMDRFVLAGGVQSPKKLPSKKGRRPGDFIPWSRREMRRELYAPYVPRKPEAKIAVENSTWGAPQVVLDVFYDGPAKI